MKLSLCIPHYNEESEIVKVMLDSIKIQQNIDFNEIEVVIANDGGNIDELYKINTKDYPFSIKMLKCDHKGVSETRNEAFNNSTGEYVMFCDVDDMFYNACGMWIIFNEIKSGFDVFISAFIEESRLPDKEVTYLTRNIDYTFVHGKVYRRKYLINNNIRWNKNLTIHEDSYFNFLAINLAEPDRAKVCQSPFYLWKWRNESVCRHDEKYILKTYNNMLESSTALVKELLDRSKEDLAMQTVTNMIFDAYFMMNKKEWLDQENKDYRHNTELRFKKYYDDFKELFDKIPEDKKNGIIVGIKNRFFQEGMILESMTFSDWIKEIESLT